MSETLADDQRCYECLDISKDLATVARAFAPVTPSSSNEHRFTAILRLLQDVAILGGYDNDKRSAIRNKQEEENGDSDTQQMNSLVNRIRSNDPTLTTLALRNVQVLSRGQSVSCFHGFTQHSIQQATEALHRNDTIRSVSCCYDWRYPRRIIHLLRNSVDNGQDGDVIDGHWNLQATPHHQQVTKLQERRFFEAFMCLPQLESISLTGGNRWRASHLITILDTAKGLKKLIVRDVVVKSLTELNGLKRFIQGSKRRNNCAPLLLESIELTIEDQTHRDDEYWATSATINEDESLFDTLIESLVSFPNIKTIKLSKSILSRFHVRQIHDISTRSLLKLARCQPLEKLIISEISVEQGAIEAMCESLIRKDGQMTHLEFYGCAFNQSVGQSGWNAMFRLIDHDENIQIRASSLVYLERRSQSRTHGKGTYREGEIGLSSFVHRPREDFSFSLRDKEGVERYFRSRSLDVRYKLQGAGFFRLLQSKQLAYNDDWINVMAKVADDSIALFYVLRENPALCNITAGSILTERNKREKKTKLGGEKGKPMNASSLLLPFKLKATTLQFSASQSISSQCICSTN